MTLKLKLAADMSKEKILQTAAHLGIEEGHLQVSVDPEVNSLQVSKNQGNYRILAPKAHMVFRGLLLLARELKNTTEDFTISESFAYRDLGFMADVSRNAVLTVEAAKQMIALLAQMGYSSFQLYMEDTYQIKDQPYFGYFRGAYSSKELQTIEKECQAYGMTFIPCIQTLAHLHSFVRWEQEAIRQIHDIDNILLCGKDETYALIDQMFEAMSQLETRKINIGMDEAFQIGLGSYLRQNGFQNRSLIMCQHLERVLDIADKYGFTCSMWSDMFFQLISASEDGLLIDEELSAYLTKVMKRVTIINWDYYQTKEENYDRSFKRHKSLGQDIAFAGGAWKWIGYTPDNDFSLYIAPKAHASCQKNQIQEVTITAWGDNGAEASAFSVLPSLLAWAELAYTDSYDFMDKHCHLLFNLSLSDFMAIDLANLTPSNPHSHGIREQSGINPNRYLLYQDILCPLLQNHLDSSLDSKHYLDAAQKIAYIQEKDSPYAYLFETQEKLCYLLALKITVTQNIRSAYKENQQEQLARACLQLSDLKILLEDFREAHSHQWLLENKIFGLDTIDIRLGGLGARIDRAISRIEDYLLGVIPAIEELEVPILQYSDQCLPSEYKAIPANQWQLLVTGSTLYTT
ncbi:beta-N-acetylhexosaminidase [Streptococcus iniae]|nr:beta-N-acetylhexosaminidase [Streptococcus iniae]OHX27867.1 beta-N-acetylhexosaminidase [Streptococcus iniae]RLV28469.1 beta-N-acetylhexosaminidase [Streptococcus iniae]